MIIFKAFFVDENNLFDNKDITDEDKKFTIDLIDRTNFSSNRKSYNDYDDAKMEIAKEEYKPKIEETKEAVLSIIEQKAEEE